MSVCPLEPTPFLSPLLQVMILVTPMMLPVNLFGLRLPKVCGEWPMSLLGSGLPPSRCCGGAAVEAQVGNGRSDRDPLLRQGRARDPQAGVAGHSTAITVSKRTEAGCSIGGRGGRSRPLLSFVQAMAGNKKMWPQRGHKGETNTGQKGFGQWPVDCVLGGNSFTFCFFFCRKGVKKIVLAAKFIIKQCTHDKGV